MNLFDAHCGFSGLFVKRMNTRPMLVFIRVKP
ncbi:hypothetical protein ABH945_005674 [Paraburkholderia sp. GAS333]